MDGVQHLACVVNAHSRVVGNVVLLDEIVELGKHADKVDVGVGDALVDDALEDVAQHEVSLAYGQ